MTNNEQNKFQMWNPFKGVGQATQQAIDQGQAQQLANQMATQQLTTGGYSTGLSSVYTFPSYPYVATIGGGPPNETKYMPVLSIDEREVVLKAKLAQQVEYQHEQDIIDGLHAKTRKLLKLILEVQSSNQFNNVEKIDKFVRDMMFDSKMDEFIK